MSLKLSHKHLRQIRTHAESAYPEECCGLLLGKLDREGKILLEVLATTNVWSAEAAETFPAINPTDVIGESKYSNYTIAPEVILKVQKQARDRQLNIIGIYHSHPDHPATPSEFDRVYAWQHYSYIIISVLQGKVCELKNWSLDDNHQFQPEEIITVAVSRIENLN